MTINENSRWTSRDKPPCYVDGVHCPKRHLGCQDHCEDFAKAKAINDRRKEIERRKRCTAYDISGFSSTQASKTAGKKLPQR